MHDCRECPTAPEVECRYCHITRHVIEHHGGHPLCFTDEDHEFGTWTPEGPPSPTPSLPDAPSEELAHPLSCFVPMCAYCEALRQRDAR